MQTTTDIARKKAIENLKEEIRYLVKENKRLNDRWEKFLSDRWEKFLMVMRKCIE